MSSPSSDPLASVITQVQPGQGAPNPRAQGPARPTKVAKQGTAKAAAQQQQQQQAAQASSTTATDRKKKKKKKRKVKRQAVTPGDGSTADASTQGAAPALASTTTTTTTTTPADAASPAGQAHSTEPSSTLAGSVTPLQDAEVGATPGAVGVGETDMAAKLQSPPGPEQQDMTRAAETLVADDTAGPGHKGELTSSTVKGSSHTPSKIGSGSAQATPAPAAAQSTATQQAPRKKKSPLAKLFAILTCSSGGSTDDMAGDGRRRNQDIEMQQSRRPGGAKGANAASGAAAGARQDGGAGVATTTSSKSKPAGAATSRGGRARGKRGDAAATPAIAAAAAGVAGSTTRLAPPASKTGRGRSGSRSSSARNSLDRRSETGVVAPAPGTPTAGGGTMLPREETGDVMSGAVVPPGSSFVTSDSRRGSTRGGGGSDSDDETEEEVTDDDDDDDEEEEEEGETDEEDDDEEGALDDYLEDDEELNEEQRLIAQGGIGIPRDEYGNEHPLLPVLGTQDHGRKCLVLDLDETLVHSSFKMITNADFIVPVEIEGTVHNVYVIKRPGVDEFMRRMGEIYEVVVFTASLSKYADPVLDILDIHRVVRHRLFRESCYNHRGNYVKDLSQLGRPIAESIIIDNSPASYIFHPNNAVPISSWFNDPHDTELTDLCPFLADLSEVDDIRAVLDGGL